MPLTAKRTAPLAAAAAVFAAVLALTAHAWTKPESRAWSGFLTGLQASPGEARLRIEYLIPLSPAANAGLRIGDEIVAVDDIRLSGTAAVAEAAKRFRSGAAVRLSVLRGKQSLEVTVTPEDALRNPFLATSSALNLAAALAFVGVGMFVFARRPADTRALVFLGMSSAFGLTRLVSAGPYHAYAIAPTEHIAPLTAMGCAMLFIFPLLFHFCLVFPRRRPLLERNPGVLGWVYGSPLLHLLLLGALVGAATYAIDIQGADPNAAFKSLLKRAAEPFTSRPPVTFAVLLAVSIVPAILLGRATWRALRGSGLRRVFVGRPDLAAGSLIFVPLCAASLMGLAASIAGSRSGSLAAAVGFCVFPVLLIAGTIAAQGLIFPIGSCVAFYRSYRTAGLEERQQMRWPLWGLVTAIAAHFLVVPCAFVLAAALRLDPAGTGRMIVYHAAEYAKVVCLLLIPVSFAFAILKHRLMDIRLYIRRTVIYGAVTGLLGLLYIALVGGLGALLSQWTGGSNQWWTAISTLLVAGAFVPVRNRVQSVVDVRFFRKRDYAAALQSLSAGIASARSTGALAATAAEQLQNALQCRSAEILLAEGGGFRSAAKVGEGGEAARVEVVYRDSVLGALSLGAKLSDEEYNAADREFLATAASQIAAGLENLRLEREQRDLEKAREIQEALLPSKLPEVPGFDIAAAYQPARSVGGDYYDAIDLGDGKVAFVMADVAGKGLPAALLMSNLQAAVKAFALDNEPPAALCSRVNRLICGNVTPGRYITFFYGVLDTAARRFTYTNAGHNPPILLRASGEVLRLEEGGPIVGIMRHMTFESGEISLEPGDRLLIFTDGVSEAFGPDDEEFGDDRLVEVLRETSAGAAELKDAVLSRVTNFCNGNFHDDATMIVVCVRAEAAPAAGGY